MTVEICRFSLQDVLTDSKLLVAFFLLLLMVTSLISSFVYWNIIAVRMRKIILRREIDTTSAVFDNQKFSRVLEHDCIRRPLIKAVVCLLLTFVLGIVTTVYFVVFLAK